MSRNNCCCVRKSCGCECCCQPCCQPCGGYGGYGMGSGVTGTGCSFSCLIILILILLFFSRRKGNCCCDDGGCDNGGFLGGCGIDGGIIFIITLFYLSCAGCGKGFGFGGY